jgi:aspartate kinase
MNNERKIVSKFGGSSLATAEKINRVRDIVDVNPNRRFVVLSAPGKRHSGDTKVTDLLLEASEAINVDDRKRFSKSFKLIASRFQDIGNGLDQKDFVSALLDEVRSGMEDGRGKDWAASRGEWLTARIFAAHTRRHFIDAEEVIRIDEAGKVDPKSYQLIEEEMASENDKFVIPGFYGQNESGEVVLFAHGGRGSSDITGAVVARGVNASVYENWTDVDGIRFTDPRRVPGARFVDEITYAELRELGNGGSEVLHKDAVLPVKKGNIPINLRNTFNSNHQGTMIVTERESKEHESIVGIAGKEGFVSIQVSRDGMNEEEGVVEQLLYPFHAHGIAFEHIPTGQDSVSVLVHESNLQNGHKDALLQELEISLKPDELEVVSNIGLITLVGQSIRHHNGHVNELLYSALNKAKIKTNSSVSRVHGNSIVVGVENKDVTPAIKILYDRFSA